MERKVKGIWIPIEAWQDSRLCWNEKVLLMEIDSFTGRGEPCVFSNEYIAEMLGCALRSAKRYLSHLIELGYVTQVKFDGRKRWVEAVPNLRGAEVPKMARQGGQNCPHNKYYNKNTSSSIDKEVYNRAGQKFDFKKALKDVGVSEEVAAAWMLVRHNKRATNSKIAFSRILEEVNKACKAGLVSSPDAAIRRAVEDSWSGFKADWLQRERRGTAPRRESAFEQNLRAQDAMFGTNYHEQAYGRQEGPSDEQ